MNFRWMKKLMFGPRLEVRRVSEPQTWTKENSQELANLLDTDIWKKAEAVFGEMQIERLLSLREPLRDVELFLCGEANMINFFYQLARKNKTKVKERIEKETTADAVAQMFPIQMRRRS